MTPTPETDGQYKEYARRDNNVKCVSIDFARKLERERDELKQLLATANDSFAKQLHQLNFVANAQVSEIALDRDAWKAKAERTCKAKFHPFAVLGFGYFKHECGAVSDYNTLSAGFCTKCGGRIVKED